MQNHRANGTKMRLDDPRAVAMFAGYQDALYSRPYDYSWEVKHHIAAAYQNGRMLVIEARIKRLPLPGWNSPRQVPHRIKELREAMLEADVTSNQAPSFALARSQTKWRPQYLLDEDLRNELISKGLASLAPERMVGVY